MTKYLTALGLFLLSTYSFADFNKTEFSSAIQAELLNKSNAKKTLTSFYGGKDISRPDVSIADEASMNKPVLVG